LKCRNDNLTGRTDDPRKGPLYLTLLHHVPGHNPNQQHAERITSSDRGKLPQSRLSEAGSCAIGIVRFVVSVMHRPSSNG